MDVPEFECCDTNRRVVIRWSLFEVPRDRVASAERKRVMEIYRIEPRCNL